MNTVTRFNRLMDRYAPLLLAIFSSACIAFGMIWSLQAMVHPLV